MLASKGEDWSAGIVGLNCQSLRRATAKAFARDACAYCPKTAQVGALVLLFPPVPTARSHKRPRSISHAPATCSSAPAQHYTHTHTPANWYAHRLAQARPLSTAQAACHIPKGDQACDYLRFVEAFCLGEMQYVCTPLSAVCGPADA